MLLIVNKQPESINVVCNGRSFIVNSECSYSIPNIKRGTITIEHLGFLDQSNTKIDKIVDAIAKRSALVVDSTYFIEDISENAILEVRNGVYEHSTGDFGYLYFDVFAQNCKVFLNGCEVINRQEVLRMQKLIRMGEAYDFPPFSIIGALFKYNKIKKMCLQKNVLDFLRKKCYNGI